MSTERIHGRCPLCGKLSLADNFAAAGEHELEVMAQTFHGRGNIQWESREMTRRWAAYLRDQLAEVEAQLTEWIGDGDDDDD